ncbi:S24 family peptidase, partial [Glaesserella parasuis]
LFREAWFKVKRLSPKNCKAMYVRGHSMAPVLEDWDTVIVDISDTEIADGEVYAVVYNKHFYIKQIIRTGKGIQLVSFNPEYYPIDVMDDDLNNLQIIGRKVWRGG